MGSRTLRSHTTCHCWSARSPTRVRPTRSSCTLSRRSRPLLKIGSGFETTCVVFLKKHRPTAPRSNRQLPIRRRAARTTKKRRTLFSTPSRRSSGVQFRNARQRPCRAALVADICDRLLCTKVKLQRVPRTRAVVVAKLRAVFDGDREQRPGSTAPTTTHHRYLADYPPVTRALCPVLP